jgi:hypothetical protein
MFIRKKDRQECLSYFVNPKRTRMSIGKLGQTGMSVPLTQPGPLQTQER